MIQIKDIEHLKQLADGGLDCHIRLNFGVRSSKNIHYLKDTNEFIIMNFIDDSEQVCKPKQLYTLSNIGEALDKGALWTD